MDVRKSLPGLGDDIPPAPSYPPRAFIHPAGHRWTLRTLSVMEAWKVTGPALTRCVGGRSGQWGAQRNNRNDGDQQHVRQSAWEHIELRLGRVWGGRVLGKEILRKVWKLGLLLR